MSKSRIFQNIKWTIFGKFITILIKGIVSIIIIRLLDPHEFGIFTYTISLITLLAIFSDVGLSQGTGNLIVKEEYNFDNLIKRSLFLLICNSLFVFIVIILLNETLGTKIYNIKTLVLLGLFSNALIYKFLLKIFESTNNNQVFWQLNFFFGSIPWIFVCYFAITHKTGSDAILGYYLGYLLLILIIIIVSVKKRGIFPRDKSKKIISYKLLFKSSFPLLLSTTSFYIFTQSDIILIKYIINEQYVGIYASAHRLIDILVILPSSIASAVVISFIKSKDKSKIFGIIFSSYTLFYVPIITLLLLFSKEIITLLFGIEYSESARVLQIFLPFLVAKLFGTLFSLSIDYSGNYIKRLYAVLICSGSNIILNLIFIPRYGINGAALTSVITYVPLVLWYSYFLNKTYRNVILNGVKRLRRDIIVVLLFFISFSIIIRIWFADYWLITHIILFILLLFYLLISKQLLIMFKTIKSY